MCLSDMDKAAKKTRDIHFFSQKNGAMVTVHAEASHRYAKWLEEQPDVTSYEAGYPLEPELYAHVAPIGIRASYFQTAWVSDFLIRYNDGRSAVRELVTVDALRKQATLEKLEFSRRYWSAMDVGSVKFVVV